jgi:hypothetical protein
MPCQSQCDKWRDCRNPCIINLSLSSPPQLENWLYVEQALAYWISWEIYTSFAGDSGVLLHVFGKVTMAKFKSSRLSYNSVVSFQLAYMFRKTLKYEAEVDDSVVSFISNALGYIESTYEWNWSLLPYTRFCKCLLDYGCVLHIVNFAILVLIYWRRFINNQFNSHVD